MKRTLIAFILLLGLGPPVWAQTSGSITASASTCTTVSNAAGGCVIARLLNTTGSVEVVLGSTAFSGTLQFEESGDAEVTWKAIQGTLVGANTTGTSTATINQDWQFNVSGGMTHIRVRCSAYTSGTAVVQINQSVSSAKSIGGSGGAGTVTSIAATAPIVVTPNPIVGTGTISCATCVATGQTNVFGAFLQDFSASTMEVPEAPGFTTTVDSTIGLDTTANIFHLWTNGADSLNAATTSTSTTTTQPLFATAVAGIYNPRAIAAADLPTTLTSGTAITNAALTTPTLGTPASGTLTNATGLLVNNLANAGGSSTLSNGNNPLTWNWTLTTDALDGIALGETSAATNGTLTNGLANQAILAVSTLTNSTATPFEVVQGSITNTVATPLAQFEATWNNAGLTGRGLYMNITDTSSVAASKLFEFAKGNTVQISGDKSGNLVALGMQTATITQSTIGTQIISGADYTNTTVTPSTVFSWTLPVTTAAKTYRYSCDILWESTAATLVGVVFGVNISAAPTQLTALAAVQNTLAGADINGYLSNTTTGSQTLVTSGAAGVTSTNYWAKIWGTIEAAPVAGSTFIINAAATSGITANINIRRGSGCSLN